MNYDLDYRLIAENVKYFARLRNMTLGKVEEGAGISVGTTSRIENGAKPSLDYVCSMARHLKIPVDALLFFRTSRMNINDEYLVSFLDSLIFRTETGETQWKRLEKSDVPYIRTINNITEFPMFVKDEIFSTENSAEIKYKSKFTEGTTVSDYGDVYYTDIYLCEVKYDVSNFFEYEIYFADVYSNGRWENCEAVYSTRNLEKGTLNETIYHLALALKEGNKHAVISNKLKAAMDAFLLQDEGSLPF